MDRPVARAALAAVAFAAFLYVPLLGARDFWAPDEPKYAQTSREMIRDGHWWFPHVNGEPYRDKPPLVFWAIAAASLPLGDVHEWTARVPIVAAALALVLLVFDLGRRRHSVEAGSVAATVLATAWLIAWMSRRVNLDVPLAACTTAAVWAGLRAGAAARAVGRARAGLGWAALGGACVALGAMIKGPVVLLPVVAALAVAGVHPAARRTRPRGTAVASTTAATLGAGLVLAAWLVPAAAFGGYDVVSIASEHVVERAVEGMHHVQPPWYFATTVPVDFLPWTFLAVPAAWAAWTRRREPDDAVLLAWAVLPILVLSAIVEKRNLYVVPTFPAFALMIGRWVASLDAARDRGRTFRRLAIAVVGLCAVLAAAFVAVAAFGSRIPALAEAWALPGLPARTVALAVLGVAGSAVAVAGLRRSGAVDTTRWLAAGFALIELGVFVTLPAVDPLKSARDMGAMLRRETAGRPLVMFPYRRDGFVFYGDRFVDVANAPDDLAAWIAAHPGDAHVLTFRRFRDRLPPPPPGRDPVEVGTAPVGSRDAVLLRYPPSPSATGREREP